MNYLIYIEHAAENLQFFLWYRDYTRRFHAAPASETALAPEWTQAMEEDAIARIQKDAVSKVKRGPTTTVMSIFQGTDFEKTLEIHLDAVRDPFSTPPGSSAGDGASFSGSEVTLPMRQAREAFYTAGAERPCKSPQPLLHHSLTHSPTHTSYTY